MDQAHGYFDLGMFEDAWAALDELPERERISQPAMAMRLRILRATCRWEKLLWLAEGLTDSNPKWPEPLVSSRSVSGACWRRDRRETGDRQGDRCRPLLADQGAGGSGV